MGQVAADLHHNSRATIAGSGLSPGGRWEPPHLCEGRSALALRERASTLQNASLYP